MVYSQQGIWESESYFLFVLFVDLNTQLLLYALPSVTMEILRINWVQTLITLFIPHQNIWKIFCCDTFMYDAFLYCIYFKYHKSFLLFCPVSNFFSCLLIYLPFLLSSFLSTLLCPFEIVFFLPKTLAFYFLM